MVTTTKKSRTTGAKGVASESQEAVKGAGSTDDTTTHRLIEEAQAATTVRESAEQAKDDADQASETAQAKLADVETRLANGDPVTQEENDAAQFSVRQAEGLAKKAERELADAQQAERVKVAIAAAAELVDGTASRQARDEAIRQAQTVVADALLALRASVEHRNATLRSAMTQARSAGLVSGKADPASPILVGTHRDQPWQKGEDVLVVEGDEARLADPSDIAQEALAAAVKSAGLGLSIGKAGGR